MIFRNPEKKQKISLSKERTLRLEAFLNRNQLRFRSLELLNLAFIHRSHNNEEASSLGCNERLEFLGDSVLGLFVAEYLYTSLEDRKEGDLARIKSFVVSEASLAPLAERLGIPECLLLGKGEELSGGRKKPAILADAFEAFIAAFYLDSGAEAAKELVVSLLAPEIDLVLQNKHRRDFKTLLQERSQKDLKLCPRYVVSGKSGPDHARIYHVEVLIGEQRFGPGDGGNKKSAEQEAAKLAWYALFEKDKA